MPQLIRRRMRDVAIVIGLALIFTVLGVYDGANQPFLARFILWAVTIGVGLASSVVLAPLVFEREPTADWPTYVQIAVAAAIIALPVTIALLLMEATDGSLMPARYWLVQYAYVYIVSLIITFATHTLEQRARGQAALAAPAAAVPIDARAAFMDRLPLRYRGAELYAVSSEDHYLRIHTSRGEELILMRLADAVDILAPSGGLQVHRSWWVARDGVSDSARENGKPVLVLKSGTRVPVSRTFQKAAREAGLL